MNIRYTLLNAVRSRVYHCEFKKRSGATEKFKVQRRGGIGDAGMGYIMCTPFQT